MEPDSEMSGRQQERKLKMDERLAMVCDLIRVLSPEHDIPTLCERGMQLLRKVLSWNQSFVYVFESPSNKHPFFGIAEDGSPIVDREVLEQLCPMKPDTEAKMASGELFTRSWTILEEDGKAQDVNLVYVPLISDDELVIGCLGARVITSEHELDRVDRQVLRLVASYMADVITTRRKQQELNTKWQLMQDVINYLPNYFYIKDTQSRFLLANRKLAIENNVEDPETMLGKNDFDFYRKDLAQKFYDDEQKVIQRGEPIINLEEEGHDSEGNHRWVMTTKIPLKNEEGEVVCMVGTGADITEKMEARFKLAETEERIRTITEAASDGILMHDLDGALIYSNVTVQTMFGYTHDELKTLNMEQLLAGPIHQPIDDDKVVHIQDGKKKDGTRFPLELSASKVQKENQWIIVSVIRDMSEQEKMKTDRDLVETIHLLESNIKRSTNNGTNPADILIQMVSTASSSERDAAAEQCKRHMVNAMCKTYLEKV